MMPYNAFGKCRKCDGVEISTRYHKAGCTHTGCTRCHDAPGCSGGREPHMVRECRNCHHEWYEAPLDSENTTVVTYMTTAGSPQRTP